MGHLRRGRGHHFAESVAAFAEEYPNIEVDRVGVPFGRVRRKFPDAVESGRGVPDVLRADEEWGDRLLPGHRIDRRAPPGTGCGPAPNRPAAHPSEFTLPPRKPS